MNWLNIRTSMIPNSSARISFTAARRLEAADMFIVRCATLPHASACHEHHAVPTVAIESRTSANGSNHGRFEGFFGASLIGGSWSAPVPAGGNAEIVRLP